MHAHTSLIAHRISSAAPPATARRPPTTAPAPLFTPHRSRAGVLTTSRQPEPRKILPNLALTSAIDDGKEENVHRQEEAAGEEK